MSNRNRLIQLIHVAKRELALEDDVYRLLLEVETNKTSCSKMSIKELETVLAAMESKGFKRKINGSKTPFKKRLSPKAKGVRTEVDKIRAIWITMSKQGFVRDGSETALDAYVRRITNRNKNEGVDHVAWCNGNQSYTVLESLKSWHRRVMIDELKNKGWTVPINERTGKPMGYEAIADAFCEMLQARKEVQ
ncbi:gp16 family protein [Vibrio sp. LaRot3]|uniref:gp16 family protein n=1 Tax=Vibrio sp. LaRot3 TaxID=2998829 RepID=UPI0022CDDF25|nr:regulatory protein GemA [Vibrio sp. LaRot3]MDA0148833.1 regulatory protein GemA [Vibrio sp. LaRot3]